MAWTAPMTAVASSVFTAAQFNQFIRDNLNETAPAKATTAGSYFAVSGTNEISERTPGTANDLTSGTTTSTSFGDLNAPAVPGPAVTVTTGSSAVVFWAGAVSNSGTGSARMGYAVSGASTVAAADNRTVATFGVAGVTVQASNWALHTTLTPGSNTFTCQYRVSSGTGTFDARRILVLPL